MTIYVPTVGTVWLVNNVYTVVDRIEKSDNDYIVHYTQNDESLYLTLDEWLKVFEGNEHAPLIETARQAVLDSIANPNEGALYSAQQLVDFIETYRVTLYTQIHDYSADTQNSDRINDIAVIRNGIENKLALEKIPVFLQELKS